MTVDRLQNYPEVRKISLNIYNSSAGRLSVTGVSTLSPYFRYPHNPRPAYTAMTIHIARFKTPVAPTNAFGDLISFSIGKICVPREKLFFFNFLCGNKKH